jgi:hypothetical protein
MGVGPSQIPSDSPLGCLLANLGPLFLKPDLKPQKLIFLCNQAWPHYPLDNASKWPLNGIFNPNILRDLYNLCEHAGIWKELSFPISASNPPSVLSVPLSRFYQPVSQFLNQPIPFPNLLLPHVNRLFALLTTPISSYLPEKLSPSWYQARCSLPTLASRQFQLWGSSCSLPVG